MQPLCIISHRRHEASRRPRICAADQRSQEGSGTLELHQRCAAPIDLRALAEPVPAALGRVPFKSWINCGRRTYAGSPRKNAVSNDEIVQKVSFAAPPERVFDALTKNIARWWSHVTYDHEGTPDLRLEPQAGGRFVEIQGDNERLYGIVTRIEPPSTLWLQGAMGMGGCIFATIAFEITGAENGSDLTLTHSVIGLYDQSMMEMYRGGWRSLLEDALKSFVEGRGEATHVA